MTSPSNTSVHHRTAQVDLRPAVIFLHIPKCGGNSFLDFLKQSAPPGPAFDVNLSLLYERRLRELEELDDTDRSQLQFVSGHLPWGVHEWLPQDGVYVTLLRHPVDRIISHYYFVRENPSHPLHPTVTARDMSLEQYAASGLSSELQDGQTRMLCGRPAIDSIRGHGAVTRDDFQTARQHLLSQQMHFGIVEHYAESQQLIARELGWQPPPAPTRRNVTRGRPPLTAVSRREWDAIVDANRLDMELYQVALDEFRRRTAAAGIPLADGRIPTGPAPLTKRVATRLKTRWQGRRPMSVRGLARSVFERCGLDVRLRRNVEQAREDEKRCIARDRWRVLRRYQPQTILDIGANAGQFAAIARHMCPQARIICFEPLQECQEKLRQSSQHDPRLRVIPCALGSRNGQAEIHRSAFSPSSSLLPMGELHRAEFPHTAQTTTEIIELRRLDDMADELDLTSPIIAKIDVQGSECDVLDGGPETLRRCAALIVELSCYALYERQPLFAEVYDRLRGLGFVYRGNVDQLVSPRDGRVLQCDGLYENPELVTDCEFGHSTAAAGTNAP